jgi:hypothetical protein
MHLRRCQTFQMQAGEPWETVMPREMGAEERSAVLAVCEAAIAAGAGRTDAMQALRGNRAERVRRLGLASCRDFGFLASLEEKEVLARIDTLIQEGWLGAERDETGRVLLTSTTTGGKSS